MRLSTLSTFTLGSIAGVAGLTMDPWPAAAATAMALLTLALAVADLLAACWAAEGTP